MPNQIGQKFCPNPFVYLINSNDGQVKFCCLVQDGIKDRESLAYSDTESSIDQIWNSPDINRVRSAMLTDKGLKECEICYNLEVNGGRSLRNDLVDIWTNPNRKHYLDSAIDDFCQGKPLVGPVSLEFRAGNICNLKCRMCGPDDSNLIAKEYRKISRSDPKWSSLFFKPPKIKTSDNYLHQIIKQLPTLQQLRISGGEPFYNPSTFELLNRAIDQGHAGHIDLAINTNFVKIDNKIFDMLCNFQSVDLFASIDGYGRVNDYIRTGSLWQEIEQNYEIYSAYKTKINLYVNVTIQVFNILYLEDIFRWAIDRQILPIPSLLEYPRWLSIRHMPQSLKDLASSKLMCLSGNIGKNNFTEWLESRLASIQNVIDDPSDPTQFNKFKYFVSTLDVQRNQSIDSYLPGLMDHYK